jgi:DNA-binding response OmpR family regulator
MKILLVEDDENKRAQLEHFIREFWPSSTLATAISLQSGLRALRADSFDVIVLDMTLPNYDQGTDETDPF